MRVRIAHQPLRSRYARALALAVVTSLFLAQGAFAYNQRIATNYNDCTDAGQGPCIRWDKTAGNLSITIDVYLNSTLAGEEVDLIDVVTDTMTTYNGIAARNPHLQRTMSSSNEEVYVKAVDLGNPYELGLTTSLYYTATNRIYYSTESFNTQIQWNRSYDYTCAPIPVPPNVSCHGDADKVVRHEFGHAEGLAHVTTATTAVMVVGEPGSTYHGLQTDDRNGIIHIYGAYP